MEAFQATPINGIAGSISGAAYTTSIQRYNLSLRAQPIDTTAWPITSQWRTSSPGLVEWSGNYDAIVDTSTSITEAGSSTEPLSNVTFTVASGQTFVGTLFTTNAQVVSRVGDLVVVRYSFDGTGHLQSVGSSNIIPAASTLATPIAGSLKLKAHEGGGTDKEYTGDAFWTEISLTVDPATVVSVRVRYQGTGALVIS
jgi:hypothetical protein